MTVAADNPMSAATDLAEHLVEGGMPFREAHAVVGRARAPVGRARRAARRARLERSAPRSRLPRPVGAGSAVRRRTTPGGGGPEPVARQLDAAREHLAEQQVWLDR